MNLQLFKPKHPLLKQYIDYFYVLKKSENTENVSYYTFPHVNAIVSINQYPEFIIEKNRLTVKSDKKAGILSTLICSYTKPIEINIPGFIHEITISFKPLGLNAFLDQDLCTYTADSFSYFNPYDDFSTAMEAIMKIEHSEAKITALESYLVSKYKGFTHPFLQPAIDDLLDFNKNYAVDELANKYGVSRKTLCKHFERHIVKTPFELKKVARFRKAMEQRNTVNPDSRFTDITYSLDFFDQSHLIKDFKSITGYTPRIFFKKLKSQEGGNINWLYL